METELYRVIKLIDAKKLTSDDKEDLLKLFMATNNSLIRNYIAFIFSDIQYDKAVPYIIKKINEKSTFNNNGSLVFALENFNLKKYFIPLIKVICEQEFEARLMAYGIVQKYVVLVSEGVKNKVLKILEDHRMRLEKEAIDKGENSTLHFIEKTKELLLPK